MQLTITIIIIVAAIAYFAFNFNRKHAKRSQCHSSNKSCPDCDIADCPFKKTGK